MMKILGLKRVVTLVVLLALNLGLGGALYMLVLPQKTQLQAESRATRAAIGGRRAEIDTMKTEYEQIQEQKDLFENLQKSGFFSMQDRVEARKNIEQIQAMSKILSTRYDIQAITVQESEAAALSDHVILRSPAKITLDAVDDLDIYSFIYWLENAFPGHVGITQMVIDRRADINDVTLRQVGAGMPTVLVSGVVDFSWSTMLPRDQLPQQLIRPVDPQ